MKTDGMTRRFLRGVPDAMTDAELLELLLRFSTEDAKELTERILAQCPNIAAVIEADADTLRSIEGIDEESVLLLRLVPELHRRYFLSRSRDEKRLTTSADFGRFLLPYFYGARDEMVYLLLLDAAGKVLNCKLIGHGSVNSANVPMRRVVQEALTANASGVVLAHNHPSGVALPSKEDADLTARLRDTLDALQILLLDHIVVADDDFVSMRESGYFHRMY